MSFFTTSDCTVKVSTINGVPLSIDSFPSGTLSLNTKVRDSFGTIRYGMETYSNIEGIKITNIEGIKITNKEENNKMEKVLNIWKNNQIEKSNKKHLSKISQLAKKDSLSISIDNALKVIRQTIAKDAKVSEHEVVATLEFYMCGMEKRKYSQNTVDKIEASNELNCKEISKINEKCYSIQLLLSACETYEQKLSIMKAYGILDDKGRLL